MAGKEFSDEAYEISRQFEELVESAYQQWQDDQAKKFGYEHIDPVRRALSGIQLPVEAIVDFLDSRLNEIRGIAGG